MTCEAVYTNPLLPLLNFFCSIQGGGGGGGVPSMPVTVLQSGFVKGGGGQSEG